MAHAYMINGRYVDPEFFAETISNLFAAGWVLTPPPGRAGTSVGQPGVTSPDRELGPGEEGDPDGG